MKHVLVTQVTKISEQLLHLKKYIYWIPNKENEELSTDARRNNCPKTMTAIWQPNEAKCYC
jgi:hypothetical protein